MVKRGMKSEIAALLVCIVVGFLVGLGGARLTYEVALENNSDWPAFEMVSRATTEALLAGIPVAFSSGIGVALSVLGNNTTSLVGVAISASLLPPAVNVGVLLGYSVVATNMRVNHDSDPEAIFEDAKELMMLSFLSFCLATLNIVLIIIGGIGMFRLKEVTPVKEKSDFWAKHLSHARLYNAVMRHNRNFKNVSIDTSREVSTCHENPVSPFDSFSLGPSTKRVQKYQSSSLLDPSFYVAPSENELIELREDTGIGAIF
mmetsp:Transcript_28893/g.35587  ORF Transcript_28893/g.35587 Transcript_28893/m.35587 type:complete len:260 (+) Transcript_28893:1210-1989(+)